MGWIVKVPFDKPPHSCSTYQPTLEQIIIRDKAAIGSIWECPKCKSRYMYKGSSAGVVEWEKGYPK
jgi:hypothetical protein